MALTERLAILIDANGAAAVQEFSKVGRAADGLGASITKIGAAAAGIGGSLVAVSAGDVQALNQLKASVSAAGDNFSDYESRIDDVVSKNLKLAIASEDTNAGLRKLIDATGSTSKALQYIGTATDLAASKQISLADAADQVARILNGRGARVLASYGIQVETAADGTKNYAAAVDELGRKLDGQAAASVAGFAGTLKVIRTEVEEQIQQFGAKYGPAITAAGTAFLVLAPAVTSASKAYQAYTASAAAATAATAAETAAAVSSAAATASVVDAVASTADSFRDTTKQLALFSSLTEVTGSQQALFSAELYATGTAAQVSGEALFLHNKALDEMAAAGYAAAAAEHQVALAEAEVAAASKGGLFAGLAGAAGSIALVGAAIYGAAKVVDHFVNNGNDAIDMVGKLSTTVDSELVPAFDKLSSGGVDGAGAFRAVAESNVATARRLIQEMQALGRDTSKYEAILDEVTGTQNSANLSASEADAYYKALAAAYRAADTSGQALSATTAGLAAMQNNLRQASDFRIGFIQAQQGFDDVYKATTKAGSAASDLVGKQHSLETATRSLTKAQEDLAEAELALFLARLGPSTEDLAKSALSRDEALQQQRDAVLALTQAQLDLKDAREGGDRNDIAQAQSRLANAQLAVRRANLAAADAQDDYNDTLNSGKEGSDKVTKAEKDLKDAQERLSDAQYAAEEAQRNLTMSVSAGGSAVQDAGAKADGAAQGWQNYVEQLIDGKAPQGEINEALKTAIERVGQLNKDFGDQNPILAERLRLLKELANFEDSNEVAFATSAGGRNIVIRNRDIPGYKPPYDLSAPPSSGFSAQGLSAGGGQLVMQVDGATVGKAVVDWSQLVGGADIMVRAAN